MPQDFCAYVCVRLRVSAFRCINYTHTHAHNGIHAPIHTRVSALTLRIKRLIRSQLHFASTFDYTLRPHPLAITLLTKAGALINVRFHQCY